MYQVKVNTLPATAIKTDKLSLIYVAIDESTSMNKHSKLIHRWLDKFKEKILIESRMSPILVGMTTFGDVVRTRGITTIDKLDIQWKAEGMTRLYRGLENSVQEILRFIDNLPNTQVQVFYIMITDGEPTDAYDENTLSWISKIHALNRHNKTKYIFVDGHSVLGIRLGFKENVSIQNELEMYLDQELKNMLQFTAQLAIEMKRG